MIYVFKLMISVAKKKLFFNAVLFKKKYIFFLNKTVFMIFLVVIYIDEIYEHGWIWK